MTRLYSIMGLSALLASICAAAPGNSHIVCNDEAFMDIIHPDAILEKVADGFSFTEGPVWSPDGYLFFSDIPAGIIRKWSPKDGITIVNNRSGNANGLAFDMAGRLIVCGQGSRKVTAIDKEGNITIIAESYNKRKLNSPNDVIIRSDGMIFFTDPPYGVKSEDRELNFQGVYAVSPEGELKLVNKDMKCPNGLAFSPDEKVLYVADSSERMHIMAYDVGGGGTLTNGRVFASFKKDGAGVPDGMKVDKLGNVWTTGPRGVWVFNKDGKHLGTILIPQVASNCAWGDEDGKTLYITAETAVYRIRTEVEGIRPWMKTTNNKKVSS